MEEARTTVRMPKETHKKLKIMVAMKYTNINDFIVDLIEKEAKATNIEKLVRA